MNKSRSIEVTITAIFIGSLLLFFLFLVFGFWFFAGFEYMSPIKKVVIIVLTVNIYLGLLYFTYRFIKWVIKGVKRLIYYISRSWRNKK